MNAQINTNNKKKILCNRNGKCCECVSYHQIYGGLPICFSVQSTKTISELRLEEKIKSLEVKLNVEQENPEPMKTQELIVEEQQSYFDDDFAKEMDARESEYNQEITDISAEKDSKVNQDDSEESSVIELNVKNKSLVKNLADRLFSGEKKEEIPEENSNANIANNEEDEAQENIETSDTPEEMSENPDGISEAANEETGDATPDSEKLGSSEKKELPVYIEVFFRCCSVYGKLYMNRQKTHYVGKCPKCKAQMTAPAGDAPRFGLRQTK